MRRAESEINEPLPDAHFAKDFSGLADKLKRNERRKTLRDVLEEIFAVVLGGCIVIAVYCVYEAVFG
jgi:hypothetical protein